MQGMGDRAPDGTLLLYRTGPFVPPISFPGWMPMVTQSVREAIEPLGFTGFEFRRVAKRRIVRLDWRAWDLQAESAPEVPETGEPEDYILKGRHDAQTAREMGDLWELYIPPTPGLQVEGSSTFNAARYGGQDLCKNSEMGGHIYASPRLRGWLMTNYDEWVRFKPAKSVSA